MAEYYGSEDERTELTMDFGGNNEGFEDSTQHFASVEFLNLQNDQIFDKVQCRKGGVARQVLADTVIIMKATFSPATLYHITAWARREEEAGKLVGDFNTQKVLMKNKDEVMNLAENIVDEEHGAIPIPEIINGHHVLTLKFYVDLGKIYTGPSYPMFALVKTDTAVRNRFKLLVQLQFLDREPSEIFESPVFRCRTRKATEKAESRTPPELPATPESPVTSPMSELPSSPPGVTNVQAVITDSLIARTARIGDLVFGSAMSTPHADIAYHLKIKDDEIGKELEEGDIVGFFTDDDDGTYVKLLKSEDVDNAVHAGVVSRSYYIAGNRMPENEGKTDTVCVIGIVKVKVAGSVENGERIYASVDRPGKAVPQSHLPVGSFLRKKHALLGMSLESKSPKSLNEVNLVQCFVCIVLDVGRQDVLDEVENMYEESEKSTQEKIKYASKKAWRKLRCCFAVTLVFVLLLVFLLYQVFVPGSMFRYWLCRKGSLTGDLWVNVTPYRAVTEVITVHGIRFTRGKLQDKVYERFPKNNRTGNHTVYYFLNLDRCAYFGDQGPVRDYITGKYKQIGGGLVLTTDYNCKTVYWYGLHPNHTEDGPRWYPYISAGDLSCTPSPPYD